MDVVKTRLQTQNIKSGSAKDTHPSDVVSDVKYKDVISTVKTIYTEEGYRGFTRGMMPRAMLASMSSALSWVSYEIIKNIWLSLV